MKNYKAKSKGQLRLTAQETTSLTVAGTWVAIDGVFVNGACSCFDIHADGILTFKGESAEDFLLNGVSDLATDKVCRVHYGLYLNGVLVPEAITPKDFQHANSDENISITALLTLEPDDYIQVWAKSDTNTTVITVDTLQVTLWGE